MTESYSIPGQGPFRLRWRFEYSDGKPAKYGMWDYGTQESTWGSAHMQSKNNLLFAIIEAENCERNDVQQPVVCDGPDFCNIETFGTVFVHYKKDKDGMEVMTQEQVIDGMALVTRNKRFKVFCSGPVVVEDRVDLDTNYHFGAEGMAK